MNKLIMFALLIASPILGFAHDLNEVHERFANYSEKLSLIEDDIRSRFSEDSKLAQAYETMQEYLKAQEEYLMVELHKVPEDQLASTLDKFFKEPLVVSNFSYAKYFLHSSCHRLANQELYNTFSTNDLDPIKDQDRLITLFHGEKPLTIKCDQVSKRKFKKQYDRRFNMDSKTMTLTLRYYRDTSPDQSGYFYSTLRVSFDTFPIASDYVQAVLDAK